MNPTPPITLAGQTLGPETTHFSPYPVRELEDMAALRQLAELPKLVSVSFCMTNLDDEGLAYLCEATTLDNVDLQDTLITDDGLRHLCRLPKLRYLRLKEAQALTNAACKHLRVLTTLEQLSLNETAIDAEGLRELTSLDRLQLLVLHIWEDNFTYEFLQHFSRQLPNCEIVCKGKGSFEAGRFSGDWDR